MSNILVTGGLGFIGSNFISKIIKILGKYQVELAGCLDSNYIKNYFTDERIEHSVMIYKIQNGFNENEVKLTSKNKELRNYLQRRRCYSSFLSFERKRKK